MAKQSKKANQEGKELDSILEQLKKSYSSESSEAADTIEAESNNESDSELHSLLDKVFSEENSSRIKEVPADDPFEDKVIENEIGESEIDEAEIIEDEIIETSTDDNLVAQNEVDDILDIMFRRNKSDASSTKTTKQKSENVETTIDDEFNADDICIDNNVEESIKNSEEAVAVTDISTIEEAITDIATSDEIEEDFSDEDISYEQDEDLPLEDETIDFEQDESLDFAVSDEEYESVPNDLSDLSSLPISVSENPIEAEFVKDVISDAEETDIQNQALENDGMEEDEVVSHIILSPEEYTVDPLQEGLSTLLPNSEFHSTIDQPKSPVNNAEGACDINDISLLLKFGYEEEAKNQFGNESTHEAIFEKDKHFTPEVHKVPYGYRGKEFTTRDQISGIRAKYKADKRAAIIRLLAVSAIALMIMSTNVFFEFFSDRTSYPVVLALEFLLILMVGMILYKQLYTGIIGILRFEARAYSVLVLILGCCCIYDISAIILYIINAGVINRSELMMFGFTAALYAILIVASDLLSCIKEFKTFDLLSASEVLFVAEKQNNRNSNTAKNDSNDKTKANRYMDLGNHAYKIRKASIVSGYFKKTSLSSSSSVNLIYVIGIVPILALIVGCVVALIGENMLRGASSVLATILLCMPFSLIVFNVISEYLIALELSKKKVAFIGADAADELSKTDTVIFDDQDAIKITSYTEIQPSKNANMKRYIATAYEVFDALSGPLSQYKLNITEGEAKASSQHELIINEINDNGMNMYFKSSMNILLGDQNYMRSHGINVKIDSNLSTATRGADCSVIYMAFDGSPKLGFIINSSIKDDFLKCVTSLEKENIKVFVESFEPQINDLFFEHNKGDSKVMINVHKPLKYEDSLQKEACDSNIISTSGAVNLANAILYSRNITEQRAHIKRTNFIVIVCGFLSAVLLSALLCVPDSVPFLGVLKSHTSLLFNILMVAGLIPAAVNFFKPNNNPINGDNNE